MSADAYRTPPTRVDEPAPSGPRWGATPLVRLLVRLFRPWYAERREEARENASYERRVLAYAEEIRSYRELHRTETSCPACAPRRSSTRRRCPSPIPPSPPPRRILE